MGQSTRWLRRKLQTKPGLASILRTSTRWPPPTGRAGCRKSERACWRNTSGSQFLAPPPTPSSDSSVDRLMTHAPRYATAIPRYAASRHRPGSRCGNPWHARTRAAVGRGHCSRHCRRPHRRPGDPDGHCCRSGARGRASRADGPTAFHSCPTASHGRPAVNPRGCRAHPDRHRSSPTTAARRPPLSPSPSHAIARVPPALRR